VIRTPKRNSKGRAGRRFPRQDLRLAAQAVQRRFTLLTANGKDFKDVPGLKLVVLNVS
jgi:predicted nucleic acid-binding protein